MTTRTELIARLRDFNNRCDDDVAGDVDAAADMLEADELIRLANVDCTLHFDTLKEDYDKLQAAARLALEALKETHYVLINANLLDQSRLDKNFTAAEALRQAIEQAERVEPVGSVVEDGEDFGHVKALLDQDARVQLAVGTKLYTHPPTAPAQQPLNDFDMRGVLASKLLCWHRLTEAEAQDLVCFFENVRRTGASL